MISYLFTFMCGRGLPLSIAKQYERSSAETEVKQNRPTMNIESHKTAINQATRPQISKKELQTKSSSKQQRSPKTSSASMESLVGGSMNHTITALNIAYYHNDRTPSRLRVEGIGKND